MFLFLCTFAFPLICVLGEIRCCCFLSAFVKCLASLFTNRYAFPSLRMFYSVCFVMLHMCVCVRYIFYRAPLFTLLTNYLRYLSALLLDAQFIPAYLIYKLNASYKICMSTFRNGKLLQLLALINLLFSHTEYLAENWKAYFILGQLCILYLVSNIYQEK